MNLWAICILRLDSGDFEVQSGSVPRLEAASLAQPQCNFNWLAGPDVAVQTKQPLANASVYSLYCAWNVLTYPVQWAFYTFPTFIQHMGVDHRGGNIGMTEQLLHSSDVVTTLQQVCSERVP